LAIFDFFQSNLGGIKRMTGIVLLAFVNARDDDDELEWALTKKA
jgi:hypothetical protein